MLRTTEKMDLELNFNFVLMVKILLWRQSYHFNSENSHEKNNVGYIVCEFNGLQ